MGQDERNVVWDRAEGGRRLWIEPDVWYPAKTTSPLGGARRALCPEADVVKYCSRGKAVMLRTVQSGQRAVSVISPDMAQMSLRPRAWTSLGLLAVAMGLLVFMSAGTLHYWQGWLFLVAFMGPTIITTTRLLKEDPALAERRMSSPATETRARQKLIQAFNLVFFLALFIVPGLDRRFGWSHLPAGIAVAGAAMMLAAYWGLFRVMSANSFASSTVKLADGQTLVSTGPYGLVRHPMYSAGLLLIFATPLTLGSLWGLVPAMALLAGIIVRLLDEEKFLESNLPGYRDYQTRRRFRLVPGIF